METKVNEKMLAALLDLRGALRAQDATPAEESAIGALNAAISETADGKLNDIELNRLGSALVTNLQQRMGLEGLQLAPTAQKRLDGLLHAVPKRHQRLSARQIFAGSRLF